MNIKNETFFINAIPSKNKVHTYELKNINFFNSKPKKTRHTRNILNDSKFTLNKSKNSSFQLQQELNYFYRYGSFKEENKEENIDKSPKYKLEKGIPINYLHTASRANSFFGSCRSNSQTKMISDKNSKIFEDKNDENKKIFSPKNKKKIKWEQFGLLNLRTKNPSKKRIKYEIKNNLNIMERIKYNKKIREVNSSFANSNYSKKNKMKKNNSSINFLYNDSFFSNLNLLDSPLNQKSKLLIKKKNNSIIKPIQFNDILIPNNKLYQFVIDPKAKENIEKINFYQDKITKFNSKSIKNLKKNNNKLFDNYICIVEKNKFSEKYQNPFTNPFDKKLYKINYDTEKFEEEKNKLFIKEEIFNANKKLLKDIEIEINKRRLQDIENNKISIGILKKKNVYISKNKKILLEKFISKIIKLSKYLKQIFVRIPEILNNYKLSELCYSHKETKELIDSIKIKNLEKCNNLLDNHKYIVLDYDFYYLTPLHWAVKKNFFQIIPKLIKYGSIVNFQNILGDTPLHIGVINNSYECVCLLLVNLASPFIKDKNGKKPIDLTNDFNMKIVLKKIMEYYYISFFQKYSKQYEIIQKYFTFFILDEFKMQINWDIYKYFKEKEAKYRGHKYTSY